MWIVILDGGVRHSAWMQVDDAREQRRVLLDKGYRNVKLELDPTVVCEDGHYYV